MSSAPSLPPRAAHPRAKWFLLALVLAALSVLWLIVPSIQHWRSDADPPQKTVITLTITPQTAADIKACPKLTPERLQRATTALAATMTSNSFGVATFTADHWFRGGPADVVEVGLGQIPLVHHQDGGAMCAGGLVDGFQVGVGDPLGGVAHH